MRIRPLAIAASALLLLGAAAARAERPQPIHGYIQTPLGISLEYLLSLPSSDIANDGPWPVLFTYDGYAAGGVEDAAYANQFVNAGYAQIGVSLRGTSCSSGHFDFFEPAQAKDGVDAIKWIANQPWADMTKGIGMIGKSFPGITQLFVAEECAGDLDCSAALKTIAPGHFYGDAYRDVAYPGGIFNYSFALLWSFISQPEPGEANALQRIAAGDTQCALNRLDHLENPAYHTFVQGLEHPYDDSLVRQRSPIYSAGRIQVPVYMANAWQDEQLGPRSTYLIERLTHARYHALLGNGSHGLYRYSRNLPALQAWFDYYLKGLGTDPATEPRVTVWFEQTSTTDASDGWSLRFNEWPLADTAVAQLRLYLHPEGKLSVALPGSDLSDQLPDPYFYPGGTESRGGEDVNTVGGFPKSVHDFKNDGYSIPAPPGTSVTYVTDPLTLDTVVLGTIRATLFVASTAPDTDFQVSVSDVWPNGDVEYVQKGWLRASHRKLTAPGDVNYSPSIYRPVHTHLLADVAPMVPGMSTQIDVEIPPVGQAFRKNHRFRVDVEMPSVLPELWGFLPLPVPAVNLVYHDANHPSTILLPTLASVVVPPAPASVRCGDHIRQPCRHPLQ
jgi:uncharacterized protein